MHTPLWMHVLPHFRRGLLEKVGDSMSYFVLRRAHHSGLYQGHVVPEAIRQEDSIHRIMSDIMMPNLKARQWSVICDLGHLQQFGDSSAPSNLIKATGLTTSNLSVPGILTQPVAEQLKNKTPCLYRLRFRLHCPRPSPAACYPR